MDNQDKLNDLLQKKNDQSLIFYELIKLLQSIDITSDEAKKNEKGMFNNNGNYIEY